MTLNTPSHEIFSYPTLAPVPDGSEFLAIMQMAEQHHGCTMFIARDDMRMERTASSLRFFYPQATILILPAWDTIPYDRISPNHVIISRRIQTLSRLSQHIPHTPQQPLILLTTINAATMRLLPKEELQQRSLVLQESMTITMESIQQFLVHNGYLNTGTANEAGEFAVRGSILDIVPIGTHEDEQGIRLDFFGDTLESLRPYHLATQITSTEKRTQLELTPANEVLLEEATIQRFRSAYRQLFGAVLKEDPLYEAISSGRHYAGMEQWLPLFYDHTDTIFDYLPKAALVIDHLALEAHHARHEDITSNYTARQEDVDGNFADSNYKPLPPDQLYLTEAQLHAALATRPVQILNAYITPNATPTKWQPIPNFASESSGKQQSAFALLGEFLVNNASNWQIKPLIACYSEGSRLRIEKLLTTHHMPSCIINIWQDDRKSIRKGKIGLCLLPLESGFLTPELLIITEQDILGERVRSTTKKRTNTEHFMAEANMLQENELIVHREHGIGRFAGLETMEVGGQSHAFLKLLYKDDDRLFVPVENIDLISRYGPADMTVELDKLGGLGWQQRTSKLKQRIKVTAEELLQVAAERSMHTASVFSPELTVYEQFCARFPYQETDDQLRAIEDTLTDLASGKPMDRLVCGDVGFGKTEVALRAAFAVVKAA